jgi:hypothetical protein
MLAYNPSALPDKQRSTDHFLHRPCRGLRAPQVIQRHAQSAFLLAFLNNFLETDSFNRAITTGAAEHLFW